MSGSLQRYPEYKDSGVDWLGDIPAHWDNIPLRAITEIKNERNRPELPLLSVYREYGVILRDSRDDNYNPQGSNPASYKVVQPGDLVLNKMKTWQGSLGVSQHQGIVSPAYIVCTLIGDIDSRYLHSLLRSKIYVGFYNRISFGVRVNQWDMRYQDFKQTPVLVPPPDEQAAIVRFLDTAEKHIRQYIRAKQKLIKLLNEQKQAIIQQAVICGLDPGAPMKGRGVEWLGKIPAHWEVTRLKTLFHERDDRTQTGYETLFSLRMYEGLVPHSDVSARPIAAEDLVGYKRVKPEQVVMNRMRAAIGLFGVMPDLGLVSPDYAIFDVSDDVIPEYYVQLFKTPLMKAVFFVESKGLGTGSSGFMRLYTDRFGNTYVPKPPKTEQLEILSYISDTTKELSFGVDNAKQQIDLVREYRTRLIADVVTGKADVRGVAFKLPEDFDAGDLLDVNDDESLGEDGDEFEDVTDAN